MQGLIPATLSLVMILACLLIIVVAYLLGSVPSGYVLVRLFRHQDIRQSGSGNIGATNVLRSGGKGLAAATFLMDMLKGCAAVGLGWLIGHLLAPGAAPDNMKALAALVAVLGHIFPVWLGFKGGKGVATGFGVFLVAAPLGGVWRLSRFSLWCWR
jgi:glycerol-3-phosphate acyltransferase PlsY